MPAWAPRAASGGVGLEARNALTAVLCSPPPQGWIPHPPKTLRQAPKPRKMAWWLVLNFTQRRTADARTLGVQVRVRGRVRDAVRPALHMRTGRNPEKGKSHTASKLHQRVPLGPLLCSQSHTRTAAVELCLYSTGTYIPAQQGHGALNQLPIHKLLLLYLALVSCSEHRCP